MNKLILALSAIATLTSASAFSAIPAAAQQAAPCTALQCGHTNGGGGSSCDSQFGYLKQVYKPEVAGIDDERRVWVTPLCADFAGLRNEGNAAYLRTTIAANDVLVDVLRSKGFFPEDVYGVKMMGDDTIHLYVHDFGR
jgi:hypothetical protein